MENGLRSGLAAVALTTILSITMAGAADFRTLYSFCAKEHCVDGNGVYTNRLLLDSSGTILGTTGYGGRGEWGTIFQLVPNEDRSKYRHSVLYSFCKKENCPDGFFPDAGLISDTAGNLYGTTQYSSYPGGGEVFELVRNGDTWSFKLLYVFCANGGSCTDGKSPTYFGLTYKGYASGAPYDGASPLYGTTYSGGAHNGGVAYQLTPGKRKWREKVLYDFCAVGDCLDGYVPYSGLALDEAGDLYGVTTEGGNQNKGTIFQLFFNGDRWGETVLHHMCSKANCADGELPSSPVVFDGNGDLVGTTAYGGSQGDGTLFKLTPAGEKSPYTLLHSFCSEDECADGGYPYGSLTLDEAGNIFGTTSYGIGESASGTVYRAKGRSLQSLYQFCQLTGCPDGNIPLGGVIRDSDGRLFGMTNLGGKHGGGGTVFELTP